MEELIKCEVQMDGEQHVSDDFVCVMAKEDGGFTVFYNADAVTLGIAMKLVAKAFVDSMHQLSEEDRALVTEALGDEYEVGSKEAELINA